MRSGFTILRNGDRLGYPWQESLLSLAPLVDELVIALGDCDDSTPASLERLKPRLKTEVRIFSSPWNLQNTQGGSELAHQSNLALEACRHEVCLYLQADEIFHEDEFPIIREDLERFAQDSEVEALAFRWLHFYGNFQTVVRSKRWYRREIRAIKRSSGLKSYGDAQGFRIPTRGAWRKARAALSRAHVRHYGWVRPPQVMAAKSEALDRLWHGSARDGTHRPEAMYPRQFGQTTFHGTHPAALRARVDALGDFDPFSDQPPLRKDLRHFRLWATDLIERLSGWRPGEFRNYRSLKVY